MIWAVLLIPLATSASVSRPTRLGCSASWTRRSAPFAALTSDAGGRVFLAVTGLVALPENEQAAAYAALLDRTGVGADDALALKRQGAAVGDAAERTCP